MKLLVILVLYFVANTSGWCTDSKDIPTDLNGTSWYEYLKSSTFTTRERCTRYDFNVLNDSYIEVDMHHLGSDGKEKVKVFMNEIIGNTFECLMNGRIVQVNYLGGNERVRFYGICGGNDINKKALVVLTKDKNPCVETVKEIESGLKNIAGKPNALERVQQDCDNI